ncbi:hypothetical protein [Streptomyces sparsus]
MARQKLAGWVDFYGLCLQDADDTAVPVLYPEDREQGGRFLVALEGRLDIESAGHSHTAALEVEVWDREPPEETEAWDEVSEATVRTASGELAVWSVAGGPAPEGIELGAPGLWRLRVGCRGRSRVAVLAQESEEPVEGVERYTVRAWKVAEW